MVKVDRTEIVEKILSRSVTGSWDLVNNEAGQEEEEMGIKLVCLFG